MGLNCRQLFRPLWDSVIVCAVILTIGCDSAEKSSATESLKSEQPKAMVPLRVWWVEDNAEAEKAYVERQWQAGSDRPLDLRVLTKQELLSSTRCDSDVIIYPAQLVGEMIQRGWLAELPSSLQARNASRPTPAGLASAPATANENVEQQSVQDTNRPAAWIDQVRYASRLWGLSLGATAPVIMANFQLPASLTSSDSTGRDPIAFWNQLIESLPAGTDSRQSTDQMDYAAICERYLVIAVSINSREPRFGLLIDPESLKCRLGDPEFVEAANILNRLNERNFSALAIGGSQASAWQSLLAESPNITIGLPPLPSPEVDRVTAITGCVPPANVTITNAASKGARSTTGWNSGNGRIVSIANECRQTAQSVEFSKWITSESNRDVLGKRFQGIASNGNYAPSSSAWQIQRLAARLTQQPRLPTEPRIVGCVQYRAALGEHLSRMLMGKCDAKQAMLEAAQAWDQITAKQTNRRELRTLVEQSLGL